MTIKERWTQFGFDAAKLLAWGFAFGIAFASLNNRLDTKADKTAVDAMARDIRIVRILLCEQAGSDSFCRGAP